MNKILRLLSLHFLWISTAGLAAENLEKVVAVQQAQIASLIARDKQQDEQLARLSRLDSYFSRFKQKNQVITGLTGNGVVAFPKITMNEGGTYLVSAVANQAGSSTTYFATIVRTTNGVVGTTTLANQASHYVGSQIIRSLSTNNSGNDTILNLEYTGMLPTGSIDVTLWFLN